MQADGRLEIQLNNYLIFISVYHKYKFAIGLPPSNPCPPTTAEQYSMKHGENSKIPTDITITNVINGAKTLASLKGVIADN